MGSFRKKRSSSGKEEEIAAPTFLSLRITGSALVSSMRATTMDVVFKINVFDAYEAYVGTLVEECQIQQASSDEPSEIVEKLRDRLRKGFPDFACNDAKFEFQEKDGKVILIEKDEDLKQVISSFTENSLLSRSKLPIVLYTSLRYEETLPDSEINCDNLGHNDFSGIGQPQRSGVSGATPENKKSTIKVEPTANFKTPGWFDSKQRRCGHRIVQLPMLCPLCAPPKPKRTFSLAEAVNVVIILLTVLVVLQLINVCITSSILRHQESNLHKDIVIIAIPERASALGSQDDGGWFSTILGANRGESVNRAVKGIVKKMQGWM